MKGACVGMHTDTFYPDPCDYVGIRIAKEVCRSCAIREECLQQALDTHEAHGIFGGLTAEERAKLLGKTRARYR